MSWRPVLCPPVHTKTLTVVEIANAERLVEEGAAMRHCIGAYITRCAMAESIIVSIRDVEGRRLSIAELNDQGGQYASARYRAALEIYGLIGSMSSVGNPNDNAQD